MAFCKIMLIGNLGRDPEMRYTPSGRPVTQFSVAVSNSKPDGQGGWVDEGTDWYRVSVFGDRAERAAEQLRKGNRVFVEGRFKTREFEGNDGQKRTSLDVTADNVISLDRKGRDDDGAFAGAPAGAAAGAAAGGGGGAPARPASDDTDLDDLPVLIRRPTTDAPRPTQEARRLLPRPPSPQGLRVLCRQDRPDRLQGSEPPPPVPLGARQDRATSEDGHLCRPSA